ncbi:glutamate--cysteine ligase [Planctomonas sp. JC2975]|uniref:carboxylate-amine ligase n=1 Tax=Planctomonas sp. JC2975 TaxID=2729626 RepID=UPI001473A256|nr:glutamate--cysteine ligase [Planctomonas sp. JC2975]NNC11629.1 glutamate--cysteine ligase [Planctomonas sp. JC2975]
MRTFGVEEEMLLVDVDSGVPLPVAQLALAAAHAPSAGPKAETEIHQEMLEVQTRPQVNASGLLADVTAGRAMADSLVEPFGARAVALGMSPLPCKPHPTRSPRYQEMVGRYGEVGRNTLVCGLHVHVRIDSRDEGVAILDRIRNWAPVLLALSANSPFANGIDTGYASYRFSAWHQWQSAGPADVFGSTEAYDGFEREMLATDVIMDPGMLYLDARLSRRHPTIEVRVADVCLDARDTVLIAALVRALADTAAAEWRRGIPPVSTSSAALRLAEWQAALTGITGRLPNPESPGSAPGADVAAALLAHVETALTVNGDLGTVQDGLARVLHDGGGFQKQRAVHDREGSFADVVTRAVEITHAASRPNDSARPNRGPTGSVNPAGVRRTSPAVVRGVE